MGWGMAMRYAVLIEPVNEAGFEGYCYAHLPSLDLSTLGLGIEGALQAAQELAGAWVAERRANRELVPTERNSVIAQIEVADAFLPPVRSSQRPSGPAAPRSGRPEATRS